MYRRRSTCEQAKDKVIKQIQVVVFSVECYLTLPRYLTLPLLTVASHINLSMAHGATSSINAHHMHEITFAHFDITTFSQKFKEAT